ncbi:unnamed protein product [Brassica rapa]|uniref:Uncharacterized protein n=1 Tax=Brassica campestris TaxID=3711 RepID=A0A8D9D6G5_BRACM|nr:unnamed protein product [Brassica rapa]
MVVVCRSWLLDVRVCKSVARRRRGVVYGSGLSLSFRCFPFALLWSRHLVSDGLRQLLDELRGSQLSGSQRLGLASHRIPYGLVVLGLRTPCFEFQHPSAWFLVI